MIYEEPFGSFLLFLVHTYSCWRLDVFKTSHSGVQFNYCIVQFSKVMPSCDDLLILPNSWEFVKHFFFWRSGRSDALTGSVPNSLFSISQTTLYVKRILQISLPHNNKTYISPIILRSIERIPRIVMLVRTKKQSFLSISSNTYHIDVITVYKKTSLIEIINVYWQRQKRQPASASGYIPNADGRLPNF